MNKEISKQGKAGRAKDGGQRDIAAERKNQEEDGDGGQSGEGRGGQKDAEAGGYALAAAEAEPDWEDVAEDGAESGEGLNIA